MAGHFAHQAAFDAIGEGVVVHDRDTGAILDVNTRMCEMHGYTREEFLELEVEDFSAGTLPHVQANARRMVQKAVEEEAQTFRWLNRRKDGDLFWVEVSLRAAELEGTERVVATVRDISEHKRVEERVAPYRRLEEVPVYMFAQDRDLRYTWTSSTLDELESTSLLGKMDEALLPGEGATRMRAVKRRVLETGEPARAELQQTLDGTSRFAEVCIVPKRDETGAVTGLVGATVDLTERERQAEQFRLLVEEVEEYAIFVLDDGGKVVTWNTGAEKISGYAEQEILGRHFSVFYPPADVEAGRPEDALETANREGQWIDEGWRLRKSGDRFWARVTLTALRDEEGGLRGFTKIVRDLTEQREREQALRRSEERYRRLFEESQEGITIAAPDGTILDVNPALCRLTGYCREELVGTNISACYVRSEERGKLVRRLQEEEQVQDVEMQLCRKGGEEIACRVSATIWRDADGDVEAIQSFTRDVTVQKRAQVALRESEEKFRALAEEAPIGIALIQDRRFQYVNAAYAKIFGYRREEIIDELTVEKLVHPDDRSKILKNLRIRIEGKVGALQFQARGLTKQQEAIRLEVHGRRVTYQGQPAIIGSVRDVTHQRRLEEQFLEIQEEERRRIGRELHDGVASQLTGAAIMNSSLARQADRGKRITREDLDRITNLINESIQEIRSLSHGLSPMGLDQGLVSALEELSTRSQMHEELSCSVDVSGPLSNLSEETAAHLYRIAQEAVVNAIKHADANHIWIRLTAEDGVLTLVVQDDGRGIDIAGHSEGLGMRTMRFRANLMGTALAVEEAPDGGTIIRCQLPA